MLHWHGRDSPLLTQRKATGHFLGSFPPSHYSLGRDNSLLSNTPHILLAWRESYSTLAMWSRPATASCYGTGERSPMIPIFCSPTMAVATQIQGEGTPSSAKCLTGTDYNCVLLPALEPVPAPAGRRNPQKMDSASTKYLHWHTPPSRSSPLLWRDSYPIFGTIFRGQRNSRQPPPVRKDTVEVALVMQQWTEATAFWLLQQWTEATALPFLISDFVCKIILFSVF